MTTTRLLIINTADVEKEVQRIVTEHTPRHGNKPPRITDFDVRRRSGQVLRLVSSSHGLEDELRKIDETQLACFAIDDKGGYRTFGKLRRNSFDATICAYAGITVAKRQNISKRLRELASSSDLIEIGRFFGAAVKDIDPDYISYQVNPFIDDAGFADIMNGIDLISTELEKITEGHNFWAIWYSESDGRGYGNSRGAMRDVYPFVGAAAHMTYTKSDGTSWLVSNEDGSACCNELIPKNRLPSLRAIDENEVISLSWLHRQQVLRIAGNTEAKL